MSRKGHRNLLLVMIVCFTLLFAGLAWYTWKLSQEIQTIQLAALQAVASEEAEAAVSRDDGQAAPPASADPLGSRTAGTTGQSPAGTSNSWPAFPGLAGGPDPFQRIAEIQRDMDAFMQSMSRGLSLFDHAGAGPGFALSAAGPQITLEETPTEFIVLLEKPAGADIELNTEISGNLLTISGRTTTQSNMDNGNHAASSSYESRFSRSITLRQPVDELGMEIEHDDATVRLRLPKV